MMSHCRCVLCTAGDPPPPPPAGESVHLVAVTTGQARGLIAAVEAAVGRAGYAAPEHHRLGRSLEQLRGLLPEGR